RNTMFIPLIAAGVALLIVLALADTSRLLAAAGFATALFLAVSVWRYAKQPSLPEARLRRTGIIISHLGAAVLAAGITGMAAWQVEKQVEAQIGQSYSAGDFTFTYTGEEEAEGPNYTAKRATVVARRGQTDEP